MNEEDQKRFWNKVDKSGDCWIWTSALSGKGYGDFMLNKRHHRAHRLSYELAHGPIQGGLFVLHRCDNKQCVNPEHLFLGTHRDNMDDLVQKNRAKSVPLKAAHNQVKRRQISGTKGAQYEAPPAYMTPMSKAIMSGIIPAGHLSTRAVASTWGWPEANVTGWARKGYLRAMEIQRGRKKYWAFRPEDVEAFAQQHGFVAL